MDYEKTCDEFAEILLGRIFGDKINTKGNYDNFIVVDSGGLKGLGKTVFSVQLSKSICKLQKEKYGIDIKYSRKDMMILDPTSEKIQERVKNLPRGSPVHIDEAILVSYARDFMMEGNKDLNKFIQICRKWGKIIIFNTPDFWDLDKGSIKACDYRVLATKRGKVQVFCKWINPHMKDKWQEKISSETVQKHIKNSIDYEGVMAGNREIKNYLYDVLFEDLPEKEYEEYKEDSLLREMESYEFQNMDKWKLRFGAILRGLVVTKKLSMNEIVGVMNNRLVGYAKFWKVKPEIVMTNRDQLKEWSRYFSCLIDEEMLEGYNPSFKNINHNQEDIESDLPKNEPKEEEE
jgi:hypothetical protein